MKAYRLQAVLAAGAACLFAIPSPVAAEEGWGTIKGQILYDGEVPEPKLIIAKGDADVKDPNVCAAVNQYANDLIVDEKTKGLANAIVYIHLMKANETKVHPDLKQSKKKEVVFDQKNCRFVPHVLIVRTDQSVVLKSQDSCAHNVKTSTIFNPDENILLPPNLEKGVKLQLKNPELLPMPVECNIHNWMKAHWLVVEHPYAAVTDKQGRFKIEKLPAGKVEFTLWHERPGFYQGKPNSYVVEVPSGGTRELEPVKWAASEFTK